MTNTFLYVSQQSDFVDILVWAVLLIAIAALLFLLFWQRKIWLNLKHELNELGKIEKHNILDEFVLKAMRIATWHMDVSTQQITYDTDFRLRNSGEWIADGDDLDGTSTALTLLNEEDAVRVSKSLQDICEGKIEEYHEEYRVKIPHTDKEYWEESYATVAERSVDGTPTVVVGTSKRIDERKNMERELVEARNRAEESDRLKTAFLANMSHEIRTPLNAIVGFTSILPDVQDPDERKQLLDLITENTQKLLRLVDDVVNISKVESGKEELVMSNFDLNLLLGAVVDQYRADVKPGVEMRLETVSEMQMITTDYERLLEIMKHIVQNATKFTDSGTITVGYDEFKGGRLHIWCRDTGKGVAPEFHERIFERFFKVDEFIPGAGLGLSISRTMAYSLGGTVGVDSSLGEGATFWVEIPVQ